MSESDAIAGFGDRIAAALDRIASAADTMVLNARPDQNSELAALREALEAERATSAQLAERLSAVKATRETLREDVTALANEVERLRAELAEHEGERVAMADLQAARAREQAEIAAVIEALAPLIEEVRHA